MKFEVNGKVIPTNVRYRTTINGKTVDLTEVSANGKTVWKYVKPVVPPVGGGGHWQNVGAPFQNGVDASGSSGANGVGTTFCSPNAGGVSWTCQVKVWIPNDVPDNDNKDTDS